MTSKKLSRQQIQTRSALMNAAIQLILEDGYDKLTIKAITDRAEYGQRVFYLHFDDKDDMLYHILTHWITHMTTDIFEKVKPYQSPEREYRAFQMIAQSIVNNLTFMKQVTIGITETLSNRIRDFVILDIKKHIEAGNLSLHPDLSVEIVSRLHAGMMNEMFRVAINSDKAISVDVIADSLFRFSFRQDPPIIDN